MVSVLAIDEKKDLEIDGMQYVLNLPLDKNTPQCPM